MRVSVIMPTWNRSNIIERALLSVHNQVYNNIELIVIDDGSTDETQNVVNKFIETNDLGSKQFTYHRLPKIGVSHARNYGLKHAKGELIFYLDSDNEWLPNYVSSVSKVYVERRDIECAYTALEVKHQSTVGNHILFQDYNRRDILFANFIDLNIFSHRRTLYERYGGFSTSLTRMVDWELILRYTKETSPLAIKQVLANYYTDAPNRISDFCTIQDNLEQILLMNKQEIEEYNVIEKYFPMIKKGYLPSEWLIWFEVFSRLKSN